MLHQVFVLKNRSHKVLVLICVVNSIRKLPLHSFSDVDEQHHKKSEPYYESGYSYRNDNSECQSLRDADIDNMTGGIIIAGQCIQNSDKVPKSNISSSFLLQDCNG